MSGSNSSSHAQSSRTENYYTNDITDATDLLPKFAIGAEVEDRAPTYSLTTSIQEHKKAASSMTNGISALFPLTKNNYVQQNIQDDLISDLQDKVSQDIAKSKEKECYGGRLLATANGNNVFIPTLNLESVCSTTECSGDNFNNNAIANENLLKGIRRVKRFAENNYLT